MTRLELTGADDRMGRWAAAESDAAESTRSTGTLVSITAARSRRRHRSERFSPTRSEPISSPANSCSSSCYALRSIGTTDGGEHVVARVIHDHDDGPDGEAA